MSGPTALRRVLLAGGSGLVGQALLQQLSTDPDVTELRALLRRPVPLPTGLVVKNGSKMVSRWRAGTPMPSSRTCRHTRGPAGKVPRRLVAVGD